MAEVKPKKKKKSRFRITYTMIAIIMIIAYCVMMFPTASDLISRIGQETSIGSYASDIADMSEEEIEECLAATREYNVKIMNQQVLQPFTYQGGTATDDEYESVPLAGRPRIGSVTISSLDISLPVFHGTDDDMLQYAAGHLYGTSIPIGGTGTHAVIAAHTALSTAKLFSDLDKLKLGDTFEVQVLNMVHTYEVDQIETVLPEEADALLQVDKDQDYVTLYTCTPYGINTHRLLIRGKRLPDRDAVLSNEELNMRIKNRKIYAVKLAGVCCVPFLILIAAIVADIKDKKKREEKRLAKELNEPFTFE